MTSEKASRTQEADGTAATEAEGRPMRADARRNYERLVHAARKVFTEQGVDASMEAIAREAGVGVGTLYRHFPRRIDVVEAVYRTDVDELVATAEKAVANREPWPALDEFLHAFLRYAQAKRPLLSELREAFEHDPGLKLRTRQRIDESMRLVFERAQQAGAVREDLDAADLLQLISPLCISTAVTPEQADRLLSTILDGLRAGRQA